MIVIPQEAVAKARTYIIDLFGSEGVQNVGLEELRRASDGDNWLVTVGFTRGWEGRQGVSRWTTVREGAPLPRTFKTVEINDAGEVIGLRHWSDAA